jgi:hypothetical protein
MVCPLPVLLVCFVAVIALAMMVSKTKVAI